MLTAGARRDPACVGRLAPPSWLRSPLGLVACEVVVVPYVVLAVVAVTVMHVPVVCVACVCAVRVGG